VSRAGRGTRRRAPARGHQGTQRDAGKRRPHRADGFRSRP
jgi:hypothetical protein